MSSRTLAIVAHGGRLSGAVIESSIGARHIVDAFTVDAAAPVLPVSGPFDRVVASLAADAAAHRILDLPFRDRRRLGQAVGPALEEHVPFSLDEGRLAWDVAGAGGAAAGATVLAAIADPARLDAFRAHLGELGATAPVVRLAWAPAAVLAAWRRSLGDTASFVAVDFGDGAAVVARVESGVLTGLRLVVPAADDLVVRNVAWSLASLGATDGAVLASGRHAARLRPALAAALPNARLGQLPAASPVEGLGGSDWRDDATLAGLLLVAAGEATPPVLDFGDDVASLLGLQGLGDVRSELSPLLRWAGIAAALALLSIGLDYAQLFAERRVLATRADEVYASAMKAPSGGVGRKLKMEMRLKELTGRADGGGSASGSPLALLAALSREVPKGLDVVFDAVEHAPPSAKVAGHAASFEAVTRMQEALARGGAFARVEVKDVHAAVTGGGVEFLIDLQPAASGEAGA